MNETGGKWTPELKIQAFKEGVTVMGLAVVIFTLALAWASLGYSGNDTQMANVMASWPRRLLRAATARGSWGPKSPARPKSCAACATPCARLRGPDTRGA
jgi:hypothetical protein